MFTVNHNKSKVRFIQSEVLNVSLTSGSMWVVSVGNNSRIPSYDLVMCWTGFLFLWEKNRDCCAPGPPWPADELHLDVKIVAASGERAVLGLEEGLCGGALSWRVWADVNANAGHLLLAVQRWRERKWVLVQIWKGQNLLDESIIRGAWW